MLRSRPAAAWSARPPGGSSCSTTTGTPFRDLRTRGQRSKEKRNKLEKGKRKHTFCAAHRADARDAARDTRRIAHHERVRVGASAGELDGLRGVPPSSESGRRDARKKLQEKSREKHHNEVKRRPRTARLQQQHRRAALGSRNRKDFGPQVCSRSDLPGWAAAVLAAAAATVAGAGVAVGRAAGSGAATEVEVAPWAAVASRRSSHTRRAQPPTDRRAASVQPPPSTACAAQRSLNVLRSKT